MQSKTPRKTRALQQIVQHRFKATDSVGSHVLTQCKPGNVRGVGSILKDFGRGDGGGDGEGGEWKGCRGEDTTKAYLDIAQNIYKISWKRSDSQYITRESIYHKETNGHNSERTKCTNSYNQLGKCLR